MRRLVEALLDLSRFEHGQIPVTRRVTQLQPLIMGVFTLQAPEAEKRSQILSHDLPSEALYAQVDSLRFSQVITNLVTNAIHYTPDGGKIRISLHTEMAVMRTDSEADDADEQDTSKEPIPTAVIGVHDDGPGIQPRILPNIFKPFVRGSELSSGVGLGLAITHEIVELHQGQITVESSSETGTRFYVRLALANANDADLDGDEDADRGDESRDSGDDEE
jgi:two-component system CheB/CheR fusion protein